MMSKVLEPSADSGPVFSEVLRALARENGSKTLQLTPGKYIFRKKDAAELYLPVSNTVRKEDCQIKHIGLLLDGLDDLTIDGNGAELVFDGDMSAIVIRNCRRIQLKNLIVDYLHPRVSEMTAADVREKTAEFIIHPSSRWTVDDFGRFCWINADGVMESFESPMVVQNASPDRHSSLRSVFNPVRNAVSFEKLAADRVRFHYPEPPPVKPGEIWQFRDPSRRENGIVIADSENVTLDGLKLYFTPGLGVVAQMTRDLTIRNHRHAPAPGSGRVCSAFADCIQVSSCYGKVEIADSFFSGAQDDPINVHGTYLLISRIEGREAVLRFGHAETWGWLPYKTGDEVCFVRRRDMQRTDFRRVEKAELADPVTVRVTLDRPVDGMDDPEQFVLENMSSYPDVSIHGCTFECYPTRGILLSSAGKCRVFGNEIRQTAARPAVYIAGDANSWYESGGVRDVKILNNRFRFCPAAAVEINPKIEPGSGIVHRNIEIRGNQYEECSPIRLRFHSAAELTTDLPPENLDRKS